MAKSARGLLAAIRRLAPIACVGLAAGGGASVANAVAPFEKSLWSSSEQPERLPPVADDVRQAPTPDYLPLTRESQPLSSSASSQYELIGYHLAAHDALGSDSACADYSMGCPVSDSCCPTCGQAGSCSCQSSSAQKAAGFPCPRVTTLGPCCNLQLFGAVKLDMLFNGARPIAPGTPFFLAPGSINGLGQETVDIHARQTTLGAVVNGPQVLGFQTGGTVMAMFYSDAVIVDQYGFLPLQAYGELRNEAWRFAAGLQFDVFAPGLPTVLPFSALAASGNAGNSFRGQVRLERFIIPAEEMQWTLQTALSEPITTTIDPAFGLSEDNGWPNLEGRVALGLGPLTQAGLTAARPIEFGVSGVVGQLRTTRADVNNLVVNRVLADVWGLATDFRWRINQMFGFAGELYTGQGLGTYNAGVLQTVNTETLRAVRSSGGWGEAYVYFTPGLHSHVGYAIDDPLDRDVVTTTPGFSRNQNSTIYSNLIWDVNQAFRVGFEFTWRETDYSSPGVPDNEGPGFHSQFQWAF